MAITSDLLRDIFGPNNQWAPTPTIGKVDDNVDYSDFLAELGIEDFPDFRNPKPEPVTTAVESEVDLPRAIICDFYNRLGEPVEDNEDRVVQAFSW